MNPSSPAHAAGWLLACCIFVGGMQPGAATAAETDAKPTPEIRYATVVRIRGEVTASAGDTAPGRELREGSYVFVGERIRAGTTGEAVLKTDDAGYIALRPRAEFVMEQYAARGTAADVLGLRLVTGGLRIISGWIAQTSRARHVVNTSTATIGIRGTDHEPYVMTFELSETTKQPEGTYDKVNRGGTTMDVQGNRLDIDPGRVGFVRSRGIVTRGLLTVLLPTLLDRVPDFYVPGQFEDELDRLSQGADEEARRALAQLEPAREKQTPAERAEPAVPAASPKTPAAPAPFPKPGPGAAACKADAVARTWLAQFDAAIQKRDAPAVIRKFAPEATLRAIVRGGGGESTTVEMRRDDLARSAIAAMAGLTEYQQRRPSIEAVPVGEGAGLCGRIRVRSLVIEQGRQGGTPYRFESIEEFVLERRAGEWLAVAAETMQQ